MNETISTAILVGGLSTRMNGIPKALFTRDGKTLIERTLEQCDPSSVFLVGNNKSLYKNLGLPIFEDHMINKGAPGALVTALLEAKSTWVRVLACDLPCLDSKTVGQLSPSPIHDVRLFHADGRPQYLVSIWRRDFGIHLHDRLIRKDMGFRELLDGLRIDWIDAANSKAFYNMNDIEAARHVGFEPHRSSTESK